MTSGTAVIGGALEALRPTIFDFDGPEGFEDPTTFRDFRLEVDFEHHVTGERFRAPGFFAADGRAAWTGAASGRCWRVKVQFPSAGPWAYRVRFEQGPNAALADAFGGGAPVPALDGLSGLALIAPASPALTVGTAGPPADAQASFSKDSRAPSPKDARLDFRAAGPGVLSASELGFPRLGWRSPRRDAVAWRGLLASSDFDGDGRTPVGAERPDLWREGDPEWGGVGGLFGGGRGVLGAAREIAESGANVAVFDLSAAPTDAAPGLADGPWATRPSFADPAADAALMAALQTFDVSRLEQWEIFFARLAAFGVASEVVFDVGGLESEPTKAPVQSSDHWRDAAALLSREMSARFGAHGAVFWRSAGAEAAETSASAAPPLRADPTPPTAVGVAAAVSTGPGPSPQQGAAVASAAAAAVARLAGVSVPAPAPTFTSAPSGLAASDARAAQDFAEAPGVTGDAPHRDAIEPDQLSSRAQAGSAAEAEANADKQPALRASTGRGVAESQASSAGVAPDPVRSADASGELRGADALPQEAPPQEAPPQDDFDDGARVATPVWSAAETVSERARAAVKPNLGDGPPHSAVGASAAPAPPSPGPARRRLRPADFARVSGDPSLTLALFQLDPTSEAPDAAPIDVRQGVPAALLANPAASLVVRVAGAAAAEAHEARLWVRRVDAEALARHGVAPEAGSVQASDAALLAPRRERLDPFALFSDLAEFSAPELTGDRSIAQLIVDVHGATPGPQADDAAPLRRVVTPIVSDAVFDAALRHLTAAAAATRDADRIAFHAPSPSSLRAPGRASVSGAVSSREAPRAGPARGAKSPALEPDPATSNAAAGVRRGPARGGRFRPMLAPARRSEVAARGGAGQGGAELGGVDRSREQAASADGRTDADLAQALALTAASLAGGVDASREADVETPRGESSISVSSPAAATSASFASAPSAAPIEASEGQLALRLEIIDADSDRTVAVVLEGDEVPGASWVGRAVIVKAVLVGDAARNVAIVQLTVSDDRGRRQAVDRPQPAASDRIAQFYGLRFEPGPVDLVVEAYADAADDAPSAVRPLHVARRRFQIV